VTTFKGRWTARVEQDFEVEADTRAEAEKLVNAEMSPRNVVELMDFEMDFDETDDDE
jgi:hypothetical protein